MTPEQATEHNKVTKDLVNKYWDLIRASADWKRGEEQEAKRLAKEVHDRISENPKIYPDLKTSLDEHGGLTVTWTFFRLHRG